MTRDRSPKRQPATAALVRHVLTASLCAAVTLAGCNKSRSAGKTSAPSATGSARTPPPSTPQGTTGAAGRGKPAPKAAAQATSNAAKALTGATTAGVALSQAGPVDVLITAQGPAFDATALDAALTPVLAALRRGAGVQQVWSRADAGSVRLVVRFGGEQLAANVVALVQQIWREHTMAELAPPVIRAILPGQRAVAALTIIANEGRAKATSLLAHKINPLARKLPGVARVWTAGAVRPYQVVQWMPPYLARWHIGLAAAQRSLVAALRRPGEAADLTALLATTPAPTSVGTTNGAAPTPNTGARGLRLKDLSVTVSGVGEPIAPCWTGGRQIASSLVEAGYAASGVDLGAAITQQIVHGELRKLPKQFEHFYHAIGVMQRFALVRKASAATVGSAPLQAQLTQLGQSPLFHDVVLVAGEDGIPAALQPNLANGNRWTLWLAVSAGVRTEEVFATLAERFPKWRVVPLPPAMDTALAWLLRSPLSTATIFASHDGQLLSRAVTNLSVALAKESRIGSRHTGPHRGVTDSGFAIIRRDVAQKSGILAADLALVAELSSGLKPVGTLRQRPIWSGLPTGVMATRQGELPLATKSTSIPWRAVHQARDQSQDTPRLRLNGMPVLWYGATPKEDSAEEFGIAYWMAAEQHVEPSRRLEVRSLLLGQRPLSRARP